ncbi:MAG TPA: phosphate ABC transporter permease PstA [Anaerolineae bacterium]
MSSSAATSSLQARMRQRRIKASQGHERMRRLTNGVMLGLMGLATFIALIPLVWIIYEVFARGSQALTLDFLTQTFKPTSLGGGGVWHAIVGTLILIGLASLFAIPVGILGAFYVVRNPNTTLGLTVRFGTDVLAGLPSIVVGLFVYTLMVAGRTYSAISGAVALAIMMLPIVLRTTEEMLKLVPPSLREASLGLGAPEWKTALDIMLPAALTGVTTGLMLAIARVSGETAPLLFTAQGSNVLSTSLDRPIASLPLTLFKYAIDPDKTRNAQSWAIALIIMVIVLALNIGARAIANRRIK